MDYFSVTSKVQKLDILEQELLIYFTLQRRGGTLQKKLSKKIPNLFQQNYNTVSYYSDETYTKLYSNMNLMPSYEVVLNIVCHPHKYFSIFFNICSGCHFLI